MPIRLLPEHVASQIAAGEVIERPASVVKEIIENALDAGATQIDVEISGTGIDLIRCSDNGHGIPASEMMLALARHATSKLTTIEDIYQIQTLGFRGEALASIAAVARVKLTSRHHKAQTGMQIVVEGSEILQQQSIGVPPGTVIEISNLFYNVPARRKFLKSETTERRHITSLISNYAIAYPQVRFSMHVDGRESFRTSGNGKLADVIVDTMGIETFRDMVEITPLPTLRPDLPPMRVYGYTSNPSQTRANRSQIILFVNGRNVSDQRLSYAIIQAYHTLIPQGRYPITLALIELPPSELDVNVHPTKAEIRFRSPDAVFSAVQRSIRQAVVSLSPDYKVDISDYAPRITDAPNEMLPVEPVIPKPARIVQPQQLGIDLETPDRGRRTNQQAKEEETAFVKDIPADARSPRRPRTLPMMRIVGQVAAAYIIAEGPAGMYLIDQHAAHERILFEQFMAQYHAHEKHSQHTLETDVAELSATDSALLQEFMPFLTEIGFEIEPFGTNTFRVRAVPAVLSDHDPADVLRRLLEDAENGEGTLAIEEKILRRVCKTAAVKAGQVLSHDEMQSLVRQLERCETPLTCPHGRPTMIHMSTTDLAKEFKRG